MATDLNTEFRAWRNQRNQSADDTGTDLNSEFNAWRKQQTPTPAATAPQAGIAGAGATAPAPVASAPVDQGSALEDVGRGLLAGSANLIGAIGDIPNFVTGGYVPSFSEAVGTGEFAESQRKHYQPETQRQMQALQDAEGFFGTLAAIPENIGGVGQYLVESIPSFVPGIGAAGIAAKTARAGTLARGGTAAAGQAAAKAAATRAAVGTEAVLGGGFAGSQAAEQVRNMPADKLASLDDFQKLIADGQTPEQARETLAAQAGQLALPIGAAIGGLAGRLGAGVESRLVAGEAASESGKPLSNALAAILTQGAEETVQEGGEQFAGNVGTRRIDPSQSLTEGVPEAAALGLALGGASGGGLAGAGELAGLVRGRQAPPPVGRKTQRTAGQESQRTIADTAADVPIERQATRQGMAELYNDVPDIKQGDTVVHLDDDSTAFLVSAVQADGKVTLTDMETGASVQRDVTEVAQNFGRLNPVAADNGQETSPPDPGAATASFATQAANRQQGQASPPASVPVTTDDPNNRAAQAGLNAESESSGTADGLQPIQPGSPSSPSQPAPVGSQAAAAADQATQSQASQQTVPQQSTENNSIPQDRELLVERIKTAQTPEEIGAAIAALRQFDGTAAQQDQRATTVQAPARGDASAETREQNDRAPQSGYSVQEGSPLDDDVDRASAELFAPNSRAVREPESGQQPDPDVPAADAKNQAADNFSVRYEHEEVGQLRSGLDRVKTAADVAHAVADIRRHGQETMLAVVVDKRGKILSVIRHTKGLKNESTVDPMTLVGAVAATEGAAGVWWAHNHPSGSPVPSDADYRITQRLDEALSGTGISAHGHVVVAPGGRAWTFKDRGNTQPVSIRPVVRNRRLSLTERVLRKRKNAEMARVRDPEDAVNIASELRADSAIMLLDNQLNVVGSVAMTPAEMRVLRDGGRVNRVLRAIDATNANSFIIKTKDQGAAENVTRFLRGLSPDARVLDWIRPGFNGQWASDQAMGGGSVAASTGPFFSRKRQGKQNETATATATPAAGTGSGGLRDAGRVPGSTGVLASTSGSPAGDGPSREADGSLRGLPRRVKFRGGEVEASHWPAAGEVARQYVESQGRQYNPPNTYARVDRDRAARIAQAYDQMPHAPGDPEVRRAYRAMIDETLAQYQAALDAGLQVEFIDFAKNGDPYEASPRLAIEDIRNNNHMWVFATRDGFGSQADFDPAENPLLEETDFIISGQRALANDIFRVVHDYFGHVKEGVGFRADGEENAWRAHAAMYSPLALRAMTTETRGQNSWVNFGPHGETNRTASAAETVFADQKTGLLPEWVSQEGAGDEDAGVKFSRKKSTASDDAAGEGARQVGDQTPNRKSIPDAVVQHNSLLEMMRWAGTKTWADIRAFKVDLQNRVNQFAARRRVNVSVFDDAHADDYLRRVGVADALYALETNPGAIGWYDLTVRKALNILSLVYPELKTDPDAAMAFTWALAVTSNGIKVDQNFRMAAAAYEQYKKTGRLPTNLKAGPTQKAINQTLEMFNGLKFDNTVGIEGVRRLVNGMFTVSELKKMGFEISGESATTVVRGGAIAGPKIGNGFLSNLQGYFDQLTMDRWLIRTWGRWTGTLLDLRPDMVQEKSRELSGIIQGLGAENKKAVEAQIGISLDADPVRIAHAVKKATGKDSVRKALAEIPGGDGIRLTGNALWKYDDAQKEAPHGPAERTRIRKVFRDILADLQKEHGHRGLTVADLQALLWYTERRLFDAAKVAEGAEAQAGYEADEAPDYANASAALARSKGISDADISAAIQEAENGTGQQSAPDVGAGRVERGNRGGGTDLRSLRGQEAATAAFGVRSNLGRVPASAAFFPGRANQSTPGRASGSYARKSGRSAGEVRRIGRTDVQPKYVYNPKSAIQAYLAPQGQATPTYIELDAGKDAGVFRRLIHAAAKSIPEGAAVRVYPKKYYQGLRLFLTEDGTAGFALQGDDIVSVFRHGKSPHKGFATSMLALAVDEGGRTLDAFDTVLPKLYSSYGFRAVARVKWDESQRPEGWDKDVFRDFNGGEPDVVLMVYDAGNRDTYKAGDGRLFSNFDDAAAYRDAEKARLQEQHGILFSRAAEARNDRQTEDTRRAATPSDQRRVERLNAAIGRYLGGREQAGAAATVPGRADRRLARALGKALGKRVVFFKAKAGSFLDSVDGASSERDNNVLFVNVDAKSPLAITGHEFLHALRRDDPALYEWVKRELLPELKNTERFRAFLDGARDAEGVGKTDDDLLIEELLANALGDQFLEPAFWARVAQRDGTRFQQLLRRLRRFISHILLATPPDALQSSEYFQDLEKVRDVMSDMLRAYKLRQEDPSKFQAKTEQGAAFARVMRETPVNPQTETPAFKKWFGDSVATVDGRPGSEPLTVYHGTGADVSAFDPKKAKDREGRRLGLGLGAGKFYLHASPVAASNYADRGRAPNVMPLYVNMRNPIEESDYHARFEQLSGGTPIYSSDLTQKQRDAIIKRLDKSLRADGVDGIWQVERNRAGEIEEVGQIAVFDPTQIKSASGNQGTFDPDNPDIRFSRKRATADPFYSALRQTIERAEGAPKSAPAQQWSQWMDGQQRKGRIRQEERDWLGVDAWLAEQDGKVSRQQLADFVRSNQVVIEDVVREGADISSLAERKEQWIQTAATIVSWDGEGDYWQDRDVAEFWYEWVDEKRTELLEQIEPTRRDSDGQSSYRYNGGTVYLDEDPTEDEILDAFNLDAQALFELTPYAERRAIAEQAYVDFAVETELQEQITEEQFDLEIDGNLIAHYQDYQLPGGENYTELLLTLPDIEPSYTSGHFNDINIVAHTRINERTGPAGERVLFLEEVQSDWHQEGRKTGYGEILSVERQPDGTWGILDKRFGIVGTDRFDSEKEAVEHINARRNPKTPDAPFKKTWDLLVAKRVLRWAAEHDFDRIAWTTGDQQVKRYGEKNINAEGMRGFYDRKFPAVVNSYTTKTWGVKPEKVFVDEHVGEVWSVLITPQMRDSVEHEGQPMFSRRQPSPDPRINSFRSKIGTPPQAPLHRRVASYLRTLPSAVKGELSDRFRQGYLDRYYGLDRAEKQAHGALPAEQRAYVAARFSNNLSSVMRGVLEYGGLQWQDGIAQAKPGTTGLLPVLKPLAKAGELDDFLDWMVADRADRLMAEGRENLFDQAEIDAVKATLNASPERRARWTQARNDYIDLQKSVLDFAQEAGLIDPTTRPLWERGDYIPFYRVDADRGILGAKNRAGLEGQSSGIKRLKGGTSNLNDPLENIIMNLTHLVDASMKNMAMQRAADNLQGIPGVMMPAKAEFKQQIIAMTEVKKAMMDTLREQGMTPRDARAYMSQIPASAWRGMRKMWSFQIPKAPDVVRVMRQGKPVYYQVEDPLLLRAFTSMDAAFGWRNNIAGQAAMAAKRVLTGAITVTPTFGIRNWTRDAVAASIITESKFKPILDSVLGAVRSLNPDNMQNIEMTFSGASFLSNEIAQAGGGARTARQLRRQLGRMNKHDLLARSMGVAATIWDRGYRRYLDGLENANRLAVYEAALERTGGSKAQASFEALDLMDFTLRGDSPIYNFFADVIPFLNARVQGLYRLGRAPKTADSRWNPNFIIGSTILTVASLGLYALNKDREEWDDLEDWDRDTNFHLWLGGEHYTIPKPFELGFVFGTVPERVAATLYEKDHDFKRLVDRLQTGFSETLAFDPRPQLIKPLVELANNKDSFTGRDIVSVTEAGRLQEDQYGPGTSELAKNVSKAVAPAARKLDKATGVGESMALAPDQIDHLIRGYFGAVGTTAVMLFDAAERTVRRGLGQTIPSPAEMRVDQYPIIRAFYRAAPELRNRYVTEFYNLYRETDQVYRSLNFRLKDGLVDRAQGLVDENQRALATRPLMQGGLQTMREIRGQMRAIRNDPNLDGREKRQRLDALTVQRNQLAKHAVQAVR